jgi:hypothetical protein
MIIAHGRSVSLLNTSPKTIIKNIDNNDFPITALTIRKDGLVMAIGDESGKIQIKDTK